MVKKRSQPATASAPKRTFIDELVGITKHASSKQQEARLQEQRFIDAHAHFIANLDPVQELLECNGGIIVRELQELMRKHAATGSAQIDNALRIDSEVKQTTKSFYIRIDSKEANIRRFLVKEGPHVFGEANQVTGSKRLVHNDMLTLVEFMKMVQRISDSPTLKLQFRTELERRLNVHVMLCENSSFTTLQVSLTWAHALDATKPDDFANTHPDLIEQVSHFLRTECTLVHLSKSITTSKLFSDYQMSVDCIPSPCAVTFDEFCSAIRSIQHVNLLGSLVTMSGDCKFINVRTLS